jgi:hypothetical protein
MISRRAAFVAAAFAGLVFSIGSARPVDPTHLAGWRSAVLWSSLGWLVMLGGIVPWAPLSGVLAALVMAGAVEVMVVFLHDPLVTAAKPIYQVPPLLVCAYIGCVSGRARA